MTLRVVKRVNGVAKQYHRAHAQLDRGSRYGNPYPRRPTQLLPQSADYSHVPLSDLRAS